MKKVARCAEVLVPDKIDPNLIFGVYVSCAESEAAVLACLPRGSTITVVENGELFFR